MIFCVVLSFSLLFSSFSHANMVFNARSMHTRHYTVSRWRTHASHYMYCNGSNHISTTLTAARQVSTYMIVWGLYSQLLDTPIQSEIRYSVSGVDLRETDLRYSPPYLCSYGLLARDMGGNVDDDEILEEDDRFWEGLTRETFLTSDLYLRTQWAENIIDLDFVQQHYSQWTDALPPDETRFAFEFSLDADEYIPNILGKNLSLGVLLSFCVDPVNTNEPSISLGCVDIRWHSEQQVSSSSYSSSLFSSSSSTHPSIHQTVVPSATAEHPSVQYANPSDRSGGRPNMQQLLMLCIFLPLAVCLLVFMVFSLALLAKRRLRREEEKPARPREPGDEESEFHKLLELSETDAARLEVDRSQAIRAGIYHGKFFTADQQVYKEVACKELGLSTLFMFKKYRKQYKPRAADDAGMIELKVLGSTTAGGQKQEKSWEETRSEYMTLLQLRHTHVLHYFGIYVDSKHAAFHDGKPFVYLVKTKTSFFANCIAFFVFIFSLFFKKIQVSEYQNNGPLGAFLKKYEATDLLTRLSFACGAASGLCYLHSNRIIHRRICADHYLVGSRGKNILDVVLGGLSCIKKLDQTDFYMAPPSEKGVHDVRWCAPEIVRSSMWSMESDVFAFGIFLWECFSRPIKKPYAHLRNDERSIREAIMQSTCSFVLEEGSSGEVVQKVVDKCMQHDARDRYTMRKAFDHLKILLKNEYTRVEVNNMKVLIDERIKNEVPRTGDAEEIKL